MVKDYLEFLSQLSKLSWIEKGKVWTKEKLLGGGVAQRRESFPIGWVRELTPYFNCFLAVIITMVLVMVRVITNSIKTNNEASI